MCDCIGDSIGLSPDQVVLRPYDPAWAAAFDSEKSVLAAALGDQALDIQHVGSTSIPGMRAKPILDIAIAVRDFEEAKSCIPALEALGYTYRGEQGIEGRHYFRKGDPRTHHIHMLEITSSEWANHIRFRDYLVGHPQAAREYRDLKLELAKRYTHDRGSYTEAKGPFIQRILALASSE